MATYDVNISGILRFSKRLLEGYKFHGWVEYAINYARSKARSLTMAGSITIVEGFEYATTKLGDLLLSATLTTVAGYSRLKDGAIDFAGTVRRAGASLLTHTIDSILYLSSTFNRTIQVSHYYDGILDLVGQVISDRFQLRDGVLSLSGSASRMVSKLRSTAGSLISFGAYYYSSADPKFSPSGSITVRGRLTLIDVVLKRLTAASISVTGAISRTVKKIRSVSGSTSFAGAFLRNFNKPKSYAGILSFSGDALSGAITEWNYSAVGVQSFLGAVSRLVAKLRTYLGTLSLAGVVSRVLAMLRTVSGAIDFAGAVIASYINADWRRGFMNLIGDPTRYLVMGRISDGNVLAIAGTVTRHSNVERILLDGTLNMSGSIPYKFKDILYFGPPNP